MPDPAIIQVVLVVAVLWVLVDRGPAFLQAADDLGIGLFRPWRGDPWPRGVQEDDDFRFDWHPTLARPAIEAVTVADPDIDIDAGRFETVELAEGGVPLERPDHVEVHRAGR